jgi:hypothetical protein
MYTVKQPNLHVFQEIIKTTMPAKLPTHNSERRRKERKSTTGIKILNKILQMRQTNGDGKKINTKQKSNKCLLTTTPNGTELFPTLLAPSRTPSYCSFAPLFAYELWIENWNCDFPSVPCPFIIAALFFLVALLRPRRHCCVFSTRYDCFEQH